jgi:hypothetical protein
MQESESQSFDSGGKAMKFVGRAEDVANRIVEAFKTGNLPKALAPVFIRRQDGVPCRKWSWGNQLVCVLNGTQDARGFRQWNEAGRYVKKGSKSFDILVPLTKSLTVTDAVTGQDIKVTKVVGFKTAPVFAVEVTDGQELVQIDAAVHQWLKELPLVDVAKAWGLNIDAYDGKAGAPQGQYRPGRVIALGVKNLSTWAHELIHAADDKLGNLKERGQHWRSETVAELGGAILLEALGFEYESDRGGCFEYVKAYAAEAQISPVQACMDVLKRTCDAVNLLLNTAETLKIPENAAQSRIIHSSVTRLINAF